MIIYAYDLRHSYFSNHVAIDISKLTLKGTCQDMVQSNTAGFFSEILRHFLRVVSKMVLGN